MLCIARHKDEVFLIMDERTNEPISAISISEIRGNKVKLGISAPKHITILRKEVYDKIRGETPSPRMTATELNSFFQGGFETPVLRHRAKS